MINKNESPAIVDILDSIGKAIIELDNFDMLFGDRLYRLSDNPTNKELPREILDKVRSILVKYRGSMEVNK